MTTAFDHWSQPQGQDQRVSALSPFGQYTQQQGQNSYQSIPQATAQTAAATKTGTLNMNKQSSYLSYLDQVVGGTLPGDEGALRSGYIPQNEGTAGYSGSGYVDRNVKMAPNAIPAAYNYADIARNQNPYGMNQLTWGGPASGKTSSPLDYVPYSTLSGLQSNAHSDLQNALIPDNLAGDVSNNLYGKWMQNWGGKFDKMASDRAAAQGAWWAGSDWAHKSINPAWNEMIAAAIPGTPAIDYQAAVYRDSPASRVEVSPEVQASPGRAYQAAVYRDSPASRVEVSPEVQASLGRPYQAAVWRDVPASRTLVTPEQQAIAGTPWQAEQQAVAEKAAVQGRAAIAAGYYTPSQTEYNAWAQQDSAAKENDSYQQFRSEDPSGNFAKDITADISQGPPDLSFFGGASYEQSPTFLGSQAPEWQDEFARQSQNLNDLYGFWFNGHGAYNLDPTSANNGFYRNDQSYGGQGRIVNNFTDSTGFDAFGNPFNSDLGVNYFGSDTQSLKLTSMFPELWGNYQQGQAAIADQPYQAAIPYRAAVPGTVGTEYQPAVYNETPASRYEVTSEQQAIDPILHRDAVYRDTPASRYEVTSEQQAIDPIAHRDAVYRDIAAKRDLVTPEQFARSAIPGSPQVDFYHPQTRKPGFDKIIDPITGLEIPNWYAGGAFNSNSALQAAYRPDWYVK